MFSNGSRIIENILRIVVIVLITWQIGFMNHSDKKPCFKSDKDLATEKTWMLTLICLQFLMELIFTFWRRALMPLSYYIDLLMKQNYQRAR